MSIPESTIEAIRGLQKHVGKGNRARGFREDEDLLDLQTATLAGALADAEEDGRGTIVFTVDAVESLLGTLKKSKVHAQANRMMLIVSEATEAHDETRSGRTATETYYQWGRPEEHDNDEAPQRDRFDRPRKPEGVPSEIADIFIRCLDFADTYGIDLAAMIAEKDAYNATRPFKHGRKF